MNLNYINSNYKYIGNIILYYYYLSVGKHCRVLVLAGERGWSAGWQRRR